MLGAIKHGDGNRDGFQAAVAGDVGIGEPVAEDKVGAVLHAVCDAGLREEGELEVCADALGLTQLGWVRPYDEAVKRLGSQIDRGVPRSNRVGGRIHRSGEGDSRKIVRGIIDIENIRSEFQRRGGSPVGGGGGRINVRPAKKADLEGGVIRWAGPEVNGIGGDVLRSVGG